MSLLGGEGGGSAIGGLASATPLGAGLSVAAEAISTPNTSASGDITRGDQRIGGLTIGGGIDTTQIAIVVVGVLAAAWILRG